MGGTHIGTEARREGRTLLLEHSWVAPKSHSPKSTWGLLAGVISFCLFVQQLRAGYALCARPRAGHRGHRSDQDRPSRYPPRAPSVRWRRKAPKGASISNSDSLHDTGPRGDKTEYLRGKTNPRRQGRLCGRQCEDSQGIGTVPSRAPEIVIQKVKL